MIREMSQREFKAALKRWGFRPVPLQAPLWWLYDFEDTTGECPDIIWGAILDGNFKLKRRATLAKIVKEREDEIKRREA